MVAWFLRYHSFPRIVIALAITLMAAAHFTGCSKEAWVGEEKNAVYKAEIDNLWPAEPAILIRKQNDFAWNNVTFTVRYSNVDKYSLTIPQIEPGRVNFKLYYKDFKHIQTGEPMDPHEKDPRDMGNFQIEGDEGYWY